PLISGGVELECFCNGTDPQAARSPNSPPQKTKPGSGDTDQVHHRAVSGELVINSPLLCGGLKLVSRDTQIGVRAENMRGPIHAASFVLQRPARISALSAVREIAQPFFRVRSLFVTSDRLDVEKKCLKHVRTSVKS